MMRLSLRPIAALMGLLGSRQAVKAPRKLNAPVLSSGTVGPTMMKRLGIKVDTSIPKAKRKRYLAPGGYQRVFNIYRSHANA